MIEGLAMGPEVAVLTAIAVAAAFLGGALLIGRAAEERLLASVRKIVNGAFAPLLRELSSGLDESRRAVGSLELELKSEIVARVGRLAARVDEVQQAAWQLEREITDDLSARAGALVARIDKAQGELAAQVQSHQQRLERLHGELAAQVESHEQRLERVQGELAAQVESHEQRLERVQGELAAQVESHEQRLERVQGELAAQVESHEQRLERVRGEVMQRVDRLGKQIEHELQRCTEDLAATAKSGHSELSTRIDQLARRSEEFERDRNAREYFLDALAKSRIRVLQLDQLFPGIESQAVEIGAIDPDTAHPNHVDMLYLCAIARHVRARRIFEFGTYLGRTTYHLALGRFEREVLTLDLDPKGEWPPELKIGSAVRAVHDRDLLGYFFKGSPSEGRITQLQGDSRSFDFSVFRSKMDLVFIDGGHTYEVVENDAARAFEMLKPGGIVVWHDYAPKSRDVVKLARTLSQSKPLFWIRDTALLVYLDGVDAMSYEAAVPVYAREILKPR